MRRPVLAALLLALGAPLAAADEPAATVQAEAPARVVIFEQLMADPPRGLAMLANAARQLEAEFKPQSNEIEMLARQYEAAQREVAEGERAGMKSQAAIDKAVRLGKDLQRKSGDAAAAYQRRQAAVLAPLVKQVDQALQRYQGDGEVFLVGQQEFNAQPAGRLSDETAAFVAWMGTQQ